MPELPEVETVVRTLRAAVLGARIVKVVYASSRINRPNPRGWKKALDGHIIDRIDRRGKYIVVALSDHSHLVAHLRMTGRFRLLESQRRRERHDRLILLLEEGPLPESRSLVLVDTRQFARADWSAPGTLRYHPGLSKLGPEADTVSETQLRRILASSHRPIKSLLLDQTRLAGLGNIYADESLHAAGVHPLTPADMVDRAQTRRLRLGMQRILRAAIASCGTTFDTFSDLSGEVGGFAPYLKVYQRTGNPCIACAHTIERLVLSGRSAHFCPRCQPPPAS